MTHRATIAVLVGLSIAIAACGKKDPEVQPGPMPGQGTNQDSIARAREDSIRRARFVADSIAAANAARNDAASRETLLAELSQMIHFEYDAFTIGSGDTAALDRKAAIMQANPNVRIRITGHCDERGSDEYNLALGMNRATAAKDYLVRMGVDPSRIDVASLGREVPADPSSNEAAWAMNRRDEFAVTAGGQTLMAPGR